MKLHRRLSANVSVAIITCFFGFGLVGGYDALLSGVDLGDSLSVFCAYGLFGSLIFVCATLATSFFDKRPQLPTSFLRMGFHISVWSLSLLLLSYAVYWMHTQWLVGIPWFAVTSLAGTVAVFLVWVLATFALLTILAKTLLPKFSKLNGAVHIWNIIHIFAISIVIFGCISITYSDKESNADRKRNGGSSASHANIILIVVDAVRADFTSAHGYELATTPSLDQLVKEGLQFMDAHSSSSWTLPSVTGILASRLAGLNVTPGISSATLAGITLPEVLAQLGYTTLAVSNNPHLSGPFGLRSRFQIFDDGRPKWSRLLSGTIVAITLNRLFPVHDGTLIDRTLKRIVTLPQPFFIYIHLMGAHAPYTTPRSYTPMLQIPNVGRIIDFPARELNIIPEERDVLLVRYANKIRYSDDQVSKLIARINTDRLSDSTLIVMTSDHGEEFGEHSDWIHGNTLYSEVLHVPLVFRWPGRVPTGHLRHEVVSLLDIAPTIVSAVAPDQPDLIPANWQGIDIEITNGQKDEVKWKRHGVVAELAPSLRGLITKRWKYIINLSTGAQWFYDRMNDPAESHNLHATMPKISAKLRSDLEEIVSHREPALKSLESDTVDSELLDRLKNLGYVK